MRKQQLFTTVIIATLLFVFPVTSLAHSGRTDSNGGHRDNQNQSGLGYYHYHCGGYPPHLHPNGVCPYSYKPSTPKVKIKKPTKVKKLKVVNQKYTSAKLKWARVKDADGYQVYRSTKRNGSYRLVKTVRKGSITTFNDPKLKANKIYYYKIKAYKVYNHKKYKGNPSIKVKVKTKPALYVLANVMTIKDSGKIKITFKAKGSIFYRITDGYYYDYEDIVKGKWDKNWYGDTTYLHLTGKKDGISYVIISNNHNNERKRIKVLVKNQAHLSNTNMTLNEGSTEIIRLINSSPGITWKSNNPNIAQVEEDEYLDDDYLATVSGISKGTTTITATSPSGSVYSCRVTVE